MAFLGVPSTAHSYADVWLANAAAKLAKKGGRAAQMSLVEQAARQSQMRIQRSLFAKMVRNLDLRRVLAPAPKGAGAKSRLNAE